MRALARVVLSLSLSLSPSLSLSLSRVSQIICPDGADWLQFDRSAKAPAAARHTRKGKARSASNGTRVEEASDTSAAERAAEHRQGRLAAARGFVRGCRSHDVALNAGARATPRARNASRGEEGARRDRSVRCVLLCSARGRGVCPYGVGVRRDRMPEE